MTAIAIALTLLLLSGLPIAFAFGLGAAVALWHEQLPMLKHGGQDFAGLDSFVLLAAPFYLVAGELMAGGRHLRPADPLLLRRLSARSAAARPMRRSWRPCSSPASRARRSPTSRRSAASSSRHAARGLQQGLRGGAGHGPDR